MLQDFCPPEEVLVSFCLCADHLLQTLKLQEEQVMVGIGVHACKPFECKCPSRCSTAFVRFPNAESSQSWVEFEPPHMRHFTEQAEGTHERVLSEGPKTFGKLRLRSTTDIRTSRERRVLTARA
eukprot:CAMPEP_0194519918 /NCGR_PEP_ID=MMETSP0253-20130528/53721_1 /TAXON_ID=2966 /ORGANISM="Noctiluca scintillans" /LENGTH=123 /DNA_ID=CAMNT_0039364095 /DNA_START=639 /DNA_END=1008 /DNA_ORIENTATION=-